MQNSTTVETSTPVETVAEFVVEDLEKKPEVMPPQEASCVHCKRGCALGTIEN